MASTHVRRRTRSELEDDDHEDGSSAPSGSSPASASSKRPRIDATDRSSDAEDDSPNIPPASNGVNGTSDDDVPDFQPGAIVRVCVENFVTYEKADFFPGPNLNMVIGPNGTGKSSLVCAICLGLGFSARLLGRATAVKEFVKHGKDKATIEIELKKRPRDRTNFVIKVQIRRDQNTQKWWLNGKETGIKRIQDVVRSLKIQVDNLCQFLPQDRVVEFAACGPVDLLQETLRAAASEEMLQWQQELRDLQKDKKEMAAASTADVEHLQNLENRQQGLQAEVERLRERNEIVEKVEDYKNALILSRYQEARDKHREAKERKKAAQHGLRQAQEASGPALKAVKDKETYARQIEIAISAKEAAVRDAEREVKARADIIGSISDEIKEFHNKQEAEHKTFDQRRKDVGTSRQKITSYQADLKNRPAEFSGAEWNQKIREQTHKQRELETDHRQAKEEADAIKTHGGDKKRELGKLQDDIDAFDTKQGQQMNLMRRQLPDVATSWDWIQEHQSEFEREIFGPPMISCSVKDERYSDLVQALLQRDDFTCFTVQTRNDWEKLSDQLYRQMGLSVTIRTCSNPLSMYRPPLDAAAARDLGFDGFAIDFVEGPDPVLAMLCAEKKLHMSGVSLRDHNDAEYERITASGRVNSWAAGDQSYMIRRRAELGPQATLAVTKSIQRGQYWTSQPVDTSEKAEMQQRLVELKGEFADLKEQYKGATSRVAALSEQMEEIKNVIARLRTEKDALQKESQKWQGLPAKIENEERAKATHEQAMRDARKRMRELEIEHDEAVVRKAEAVLSHVETLEVLKTALDSLTEAVIWHKEAVSDLEGLKSRNADIIKQLEEEQQKIDAATAEAEQLKASAIELRTAVEHLMGENDEEKRAVYQELARDKVPADIQMEIDAEAAKLELIHAANPNVIQDFERRAAEIAKLKRKMDGMHEKLGLITTQVDKLMGQYEPKLDELVRRINDAFAYNFEQISCAGEVRVHKDPDFDLWALDIMVKFREDEALQQLNAHRQSGGERAVSTIFFLMALQSMAQSPFRVVDEINQGMDPRNERMVHERMVEIACREHTSQYFLITPKLLTGLKYDKKMRVLCIASGEHMPREGRKLDFGRCLKMQRQLMSGTAAAGA
ncbi:AAA domain-containing protein [Sarocladium implicatum]|nr:AAA domain-containing protein [Sarocladium implicatum]